MEIEGFRFDVWALAAAMLVLLWFWHRQTRTRTRRDRGEMFDDCLDTFERPVIEQDDVNFPVLTAQYKGQKVRLEPIIDQMTFRKLPSLWMSLTIYCPVPVAGTIDYLVRPQNTEFYSPWSRLPYDLDIPKDWPEHAVLRTDAETALPLDAITPSIRVFKEDPKVKELLITKSGVRFVYQLDESQRSHYLVLRQPLFESLQVDKDKMQVLLDSAIDLADALKSGHSQMTVAYDCAAQVACQKKNFIPSISFQTGV